MIETLTSARGCTCCRILASGRVMAAPGQKEAESESDHAMSNRPSCPGKLIVSYVAHLLVENQGLVAHYSEHGYRDIKSDFDPGKPCIFVSHQPISMI